MTLPLVVSIILVPYYRCSSASTAGLCPDKPIEVENLSHNSVNMQNLLNIIA
jgi:hypothetical protein